MRSHLLPILLSFLGGLRLSFVNSQMIFMFIFYELVFFINDYHIKWDKVTDKEGERERARFKTNKLPF